MSGLVIFGAKMLIGAAKAYAVSQADNDLSDLAENFIDKLGDVVGDHLTDEKTLEWAKTLCKELLKGKNAQQAEEIAVVAGCLKNVGENHLPMMVYCLKDGVDGSKERFIQRCWNTSEKYRVKQYYSDAEQFKKMFWEVAGKLYDASKENGELSLELEATILNGVHASNEKLDSQSESLNYIIKMLEEQKHLKEESSRFIDTENELEEFQGRFFAPLFLEEKNNNPVCLMNVYQKPIYKTIAGLNENLSIDELLEKCITCSDKDYAHRMLVVLGQPGGGKSSLMAYLLSDQRFVGLLAKKGRKARVFHFNNLAVDWESPRFDKISVEILEQFGINKNKRSELSNTLLILDGFDEIQLKSENRVKLLNRLRDDWCKYANVKNFNLIVTCRENCFDCCECSTISLMPMNKRQISDYANTYWDLGQKNFKKREEAIAGLMENDLPEIMGIPILLYLTLALNIPIKMGMIEADIYDMVFSIEGKHSIYRREQYDRTAHRLADYAPAIHEFSKRVALWIFDNQPREDVPKAEYQRMEREVIAELRLEEMQEGDSLIGQFFKCQYAEGKDAVELRFVHRTIYEYFVARAFHDCILSFNDVSTADELWVERNRLSHLADILGMQSLIEFPKIQSYLSHLLKKDSGNRIGDWWSKFMDSFLLEGLPHIENERKKGGLALIKEESLYFLNLIWIIREVKIMKEEKAPFGVWSGYGNLDANSQPIEETERVSKLVDNVSKYLRILGAEHEKMDLREVDLRRTDLYGAHLRGAHLSEADLRGANLSGADLGGADLCSSDLRGANLSRAHLFNADLSKADLGRANLSGANLSRANLFNADLSEADLFNADLSEADLGRANLSGANLSGANLSGAHLRGADLPGAHLSGADLSGADLGRADLSGAHLSGAHLSGADLYDADLSGADLRRADLCRADLSEADLSGADLRGANLSGADLSSADLSGADLRGAKLSHEQLKKALYFPIDMKRWSDPENAPNWQD